MRVALARPVDAPAVLMHQEIDGITIPDDAPLAAER